MNIAQDNQSNLPVQTSNRHALVIGGSMAGLLAARVLSDYYDQVTILDRDTFPEVADHRKGVPQSHHAHALLPRGQMIIEQLFPGILENLRADGALSVYNSVPIVIVSPAGKLPTQRQQGEYIAFSRYLLEWHIRHRLAQNPHIHLLPNIQVDGLLTTADRTRVIGVSTRERGVAGQAETFNADLVVDASGRHSQAPAWLLELGYEAPPEESINSGLGYASRFYEKPADFPDDWQGIIINGRPPHNPRAGLILPVDNGRWHVTLGGIAGHFPPLDEEGFLRFAKELPDPSIYEALRVARPLTPLRSSRTLENHLRHFERLKRWPKGFIVTGDAVGAFNPIYGQGITTSALDAMALADCLQEEARAPRPDFEQHFQQRLSETIANPWLVATGEDLRWAGVKLSGARPPLELGLLHGYMNLVLRCAVADPVVAQAYMSVIGMFAPPQSLVSPRILLRVMGSAIKRAFGATRHSDETALSSTSLAFLRARPSIEYHTTQV